MAYTQTPRFQLIQQSPCFVNKGKVSRCYNLKPLKVEQRNQNLNVVELDGVEVNSNLNANEWSKKDETQKLDLQCLKDVENVDKSLDFASGEVVNEYKHEEMFQDGPIMYVTKPLPRVLLIHTGGTLGMDPGQSYESDQEGLHLIRGTGGSYKGSLQPGDLLSNLKEVVPEMSVFGNLHLEVAFNKDSSRVGPQDWVRLAKLLDANRHKYDAFLVIHGTDTMAYTASALSMMMLGFKKPVILTGSQLPLAMPRSDARQNLIDSITCATSYFSPPHVELQEVGICFGGKLMRGNRAQKVNSSQYAAFDSPSYPHLASLGVDIEWNMRFLLRPEGAYRPRFKLNPNVIRIPIVPGCDPCKAYGDLISRGVKGVVLEAFGVGNMPDQESAGWLPWLRDQRSKGLQVYLASQCTNGPLQPELYHSGSVALALGVEAGPQMTPECAVVKMMLCMAYPDIPPGVPLAGEM
eukprot:TRINITY_DN13836_c0_g1_i11.p1 TRINITY_DN13836_c0_g1~~TRINITY_DN13836_c0_g1_i11.p1  ORF type:complete len:476 (+),score=54.06 TRINITY_DN13836_c0_g1_i11:39-1430(+)